MPDLMTIIDKLKLWQFTLLMSIALLGLGFTGNSILAVKGLIEGKENMAIFVGVICLIITIVLKYFPPTED